MANEGLQVPKTWGKEIYICNEPLYTAKWLYVSASYVCSTHRHPIKTETFHVTVGSGVIIIEAEVQKVDVGSTVHVPRGAWHCFATATGMTLLEVSTRHLDSDVERASPSRRLTWKRDTTLLRLLGAAEPGEPFSLETKE